jgi:hypothetical protein
MPGHLDHSPADVLRYLMIAHNLGSIGVGPTTDDWRIFVDNEPDSPDNVVTVYNTTSRPQGRHQTDGEIQEMHGVQIRVRSQLSKEGYAKARSIAIELDEGTYRENVTIDSAVYCFHSFTRIGDIISIGKDAPTPTKRNVHVFNGLLTLTQKTIGTGNYF